MEDPIRFEGFLKKFQNKRGFKRIIWILCGSQKKKWNKLRHGGH